MNNRAADVIVRGDASGFLQKIVSGTHHFEADEPVSVGGTETAPTPLRLSPGRARHVHLDDCGTLRAAQEMAA